MLALSPVRAAILFEASLALAAGALYGLLGGSLGPWPPLKDARGYALGVLQGIAATLPLLVMLLVLDRYPIGPLRRLKHLSDHLLVPFFARASLAQLALVSLAAGVGEELLFRGWVQSSLTQWLTGPWSATSAALFANVVAAVLFGVCHWLSLTYAVLAMLVGAYLGLVLIVTGNLVAPVTAHALYDFLALVYLVRFTRRTTP